MTEEKKATRSSDRSRELFGNEYNEIPKYERRSKLPTGAYLIGRMLHLCKIVEKGQTQMSKDNASMIVAQEAREDWISKNVYPKMDRAVAKQIKEDYEEFLKIAKYYRSGQTKSEKWLCKAREFNGKLTMKAYDIRTKNKEHQRNMEDIGVKMTEEDEMFYQDNYHGNYIATCTQSVPEKWRRKKKRESSRNLTAEKRQRKEEGQKESEEARKLDFEGEYDSSVESDEDAMPDEQFETHQMIIPDKPTCSKSTRSNPTTSTENAADISQSFSVVNVRKSRKKLNESLVRCIVQCSADYKVSYNDLAGIMVRVANMVFGQCWALSGTGAEPSEENETDNSCDEDEDIETTPKSKKKRRNTMDLTNIFPSRRCVQMYLEDGQFLNLKLVAESLLEKDKTVVTVGIDDTTKAAGYKLYDIKSDHITVEGAEGKKILTTGFMENVSHSGEDSAVTYTNNLKILALLGDSTVDELKAAIDFWITDRAADCDTFLAEMGVGIEKILKCCGHVILAVNNSCDKVFRDVEQKIGVQYLLTLVGARGVSVDPMHLFYCVL